MCPASLPFVTKPSGAAAASQEQTDLQAKVDSAARESAAKAAAHEEALAAVQQQMVQAEHQSRADKKVSPVKVCRLWSHQHFATGGALIISCVLPQWTASLDASNFVPKVSKKEADSKTPKASSLCLREQGAPTRAVLAANIAVCSRCASWAPRWCHLFARQAVDQACNQVHLTVLPSTRHSLNHNSQCWGLADGCMWRPLSWHVDAHQISGRPC